MQRWFPHMDGGGGTREQELESHVLNWSIWAADWQREAGLADLERLPEPPNSIQAFGAYFNERDELLLREAFKGMAGELKALYADMAAAEKPSLYVTVINDIVRPDGANSEKDSGLAGRLTATAEARSAHIDAIVGMARELGANGVEIDYENIADRDWDAMAIFYKELWERLEREELELRIVLEPRAPVDKVKLPEGPDYVMMAYNLYGTHGGPGPKADIKMIGRLAAKLDGVPGDSAMAFATGGFDWKAEKDAAALTEAEAAALAAEKGAQPERDEDSGALSFVYTDGDGSKHTVWYADAETLRIWIEAAGKRGIGEIAIWRAGGLSQPTLDYLGKL
jgi:spore germination protein YaaH